MNRSANLTKLKKSERLTYILLALIENFINKEEVTNFSNLIQQITKNKIVWSQRTLGIYVNHDW